MIIERSDAYTLTLKANTSEDVEALDRIQVACATRPLHWWFRGKVNVELAKKIVEMRRQGKI